MLQGVFLLAFDLPDPPGKSFGASVLLDLLLAVIAAILTFGRLADRERPLYSAIGVPVAVVIGILNPLCSLQFLPIKILSIQFGVFLALSVAFYLLCFFITSLASGVLHVHRTSI